MNVLVPVVDPMADIDPAQNPDRANEFAECLLNEGWGFDEVGEWARVLTMLSPHCLRFELSGRVN